MSFRSIYLELIWSLCPKSVVTNRLWYNGLTWRTMWGWGSGCGSVGRAVASNQRSAVRIQSSAKIYLYLTFVYCQLCIEKTIINKKRGRGWPIFFKKRKANTCFSSIITNQNQCDQKKNRQISIKVALKWFHYKNDRF